VLGVLAALALGQPFWVTRSLGAADDPVSVDEAFLRKNGIHPDGPSLLEFFRKRALSDADRRRLGSLVRQLGDRSYVRRMKAKKELISIGEPAAAFLEPALKDADLEIVRLAKESLAAIRRGPGQALPAAAARLLAHHRPAGAVEALLRYVPYIDDDWLEGEVLASLARLALSEGKVDPALTAALGDSVPRCRAAAAFILGRSGGPEQRAAVRRMLADPDPLVRQFAARGLIGEESSQPGVEESSGDLALLKENKVATDTAGLLTFIRKRSLSDADRRRLQELVARLEDRNAENRRQAASNLIQAGNLALPFLRAALKNPDTEVVKRAQKCILEIDKGPGSALPIAAIHVLVARAPGEAVKTLLAYTSSAEDDLVEEAILEGLCALAVRQEKLDPALAAALRDPVSARRAAAAYVLGRVGTRGDCDAVRSLLRDMDGKARVRAAQGLLFAKERSALPVLLEMLGDKTAPEAAALAEGVLRQIAGDNPPEVPALGNTPEDRRKAQETWQAWWRDQGARIDLARLTPERADRGLTVICEFDGTRKGKGQVWEFGRDFQRRWLIEGLEGPMDAHMLAGDRVLIAEYYAMKVTERDLGGDIKWEHRVGSYPIACGRMRNGNIFIATYTNLIEVTRDYKVIHDYNRGADGQIYSAQKLNNGHIVYMTSLGNVVELNGATGEVIHKFNVGYPGAWCGIEWLGTGRYLVCLMASGKVMEVDSRGRVSWEATVKGAHQTLRLRNGRILIVCMNDKRLVELDRASKKPVWEKSMEGRPWRVHRR
jgi:HEAT repeat protein